jgi:hypothetical protein
MTSQWTATEKLVEREQRRKLQEQEAQRKRNREVQEEKRVEEEDEKWLREVEQANNRPNRGPSLPTFDEFWEPNQQEKL